eukprot:TRINITY_DN64772_c0_g1_i1.p1 TRINITY_DN64772_c0_g1~~TRINITY_DN64772_c0_g1_i1.p1  ORF type:complete len:259 (+),score=44.49 TRINITY_DN64772_c0_g1_i1:215-991(+)
MAFKAAVSKVSVPTAGARLLKTLHGLPNLGGFPHLRLAERSHRFCVLHLLGRAGLPPAYFNDDFLAGASGAFKHFNNTMMSPGILGTEQGVEPSFGTFCSEARQSLADAELEIQWKLEDVTEISLGSVGLVYGVRRSQGLPQNEWAAGRATYLGLTVVFRGEQRRVIARDGATIFADALIKAKQTVTLQKKSNGSVLAGQFDDAAIHCLRLEAELIQEGGEGAHPWHLRFDDDRGWSISDLNGALGGNSVAAPLPEAN